MSQESRPHAVAGVCVLAGAAMIALAGSQPWGTRLVTLKGWVTHARPQGSLGFELLPGPGSHFGDVTPMLIGGAAVLGFAALLLLVTPVPGPGVLWRFLALVTVTGLAVISVPAWSVVNDPTSVLVDPGAPPDEVLGRATSVAQLPGLLEVQPGLGLWLLTIGSAIAGIGALVPVTRRRPLPTEVPAPTAGRRASIGLSPGWCPEQRGGSAVRRYDGDAWVAAVGPRD